MLEKHTNIFSKASYNNQARIHNGYHYPRDFLTALRSCKNYSLFLDQFKDSIVDNFSSFYAISKQFSQVNKTQFFSFFNALGVPIKTANQNIKKLFNPGLIEEVFEVKEHVFNAKKLSEIFLGYLTDLNIELLCSHEVKKVTRKKSKICLYAQHFGEGVEVFADQVFNCTYANLNTVLNNSNMPIIPLKYEITELCLIETPNVLRGMAITVMCGPFFSFMPFPDKNLYTLSHVRYTPHTSFTSEDTKKISPYKILNRYKKNSHFNYMIADACRYLPEIKKSVYMDSLWEIKTILPINELNDGRPILFKPNHGFPGFHCVLGGKIDNLFDVTELISNNDF